MYENAMAGKNMNISNPTKIYTIVAKDMNTLDVCLSALNWQIKQIISKLMFNLQIIHKKIIRNTKTHTDKNKIKQMGKNSITPSYFKL